MKNWFAIKMLMAILQRITFTFTSSTTKVPNICNTLAQRPSRCKVFICFPYLAARMIGSNKHIHGYCKISVGFRNPVIFCNTNQLHRILWIFPFFSNCFFCWKIYLQIIISKKTQLEDFLDHSSSSSDCDGFWKKNIRNIPFGRPDTGRRNLIFGRGGFCFSVVFP